MKPWKTLLCILLAPGALAQLPAMPTDLDGCHGAKKPLVMLSGTPFMRVSIQGQEGLFLLDWATTRSVIDIITFQTPPKPDLSSGKALFDISDYFGSPFTKRQFEMQYLTKYILKDDAGTSFSEAGILGTDLLNYAFTLDFRKSSPAVYRQFPDSVCKDDVLRREGFSPVSTMGFFSYPNASTDDLDEPLPVLTVPLRVGGAWAPAQVDTGFGDTVAAHSINFNRGFLREMRAHGVRLRPVTVTDRDGNIVPSTLSLSTCVPDVSETVTEYVADDDLAAEIMGIDGTPVRSVTKLRMFLKESPVRAKSCGGIGTWEKPGAQLGASFVTEAETVVIDAYSARMWFRNAAGPR